MPFPRDSALGQLMSRFAQPGRVRWIGLRPARGAPMAVVDRVEAVEGAGLVGDRFKRSSTGKRGVTLIQAEHLPAIASLASLSAVAPETLRRNLVVEGVPLVALVGRRFRVGEVLLEGTGPCDPCSRMEEALGHGGYNAMRGMGGITARVLEGGRIAVGDAVAPAGDDDGDPRQPSLEL
jgi:MOSC domain-containing protein YiiM